VALWNLWEEAVCLPRAAKDAFMEDSLTDVIVSNIGSEKITSPQEAKLFTVSQSKKLVQGSDALAVAGSLDRIAAKVLLFSIGKPAPRDGKLGKLVRSVKLSDKYKVPLVQLYHEANIPKLLCRIPELSKEDAISRASFEAVMTLLHYTTGVKPENMMYVMDPELGTEIRFDSVHSKLIDELTASAALPSGAFPGEVISVGQFKCNLPTILSSLHFLARKGYYLRKRDPQGKEEVYTVSSQELRATFNSRTGLSDKSKSFSAMLLKAALAVTVSTTNRIFPGGWIKATRSINQVKSDSGLAFKMGYCEKIPYHHKLNAVITNTVVKKPDGKLHVVSQAGSEYKKYSFIEFRAGTVFTAPTLDTSSDISFETQMKRDPLTIKSEKTLEAYSDTKYHKAINSLNRAHALLTTVSKGNTKTTPIHYEIARNEFLHLCAKVPIRDGTGREVQNFSELQKPIYDFCRKLYRFQDKSKRDLEESQDSVEVMEVDQPVKKAKTDAGNSAPITRAKSVEREQSRTSGKTAEPSKTQKSTRGGRKSRT
jgi:hypothetical protein